MRDIRPEFIGVFNALPVGFMVFFKVIYSHLRSNVSPCKINFISAFTKIGGPPIPLKVNFAVNKHLAAGVSLRFPLINFIA
jgi:hypothetical protein